MIVICEECGKKYRIDPAKIKGMAASFRCKSCHHTISVSKPEVHASSSSSPSLMVSDLSATQTEVSRPKAEKEIGTARPTAEKLLSKTRRRRSWLGLRTKMIVLFLFLPLLLMVGASLLYLVQLEKMTTILGQESKNIVNKMAEEKIANLSTAVAKQCQLYLLANPALEKEAFMNDQAFKTLAVQRVGLTGYTALYEIPDDEGIWRTWAHVNPNIIGIDMLQLRDSLGVNFPGFWKVYTGVKGGKRSQGYYTWQDKDGTFRDKFMVCTPIAGTPYIIAATTYLDEFTQPIRQMENRAQSLTEDTRKLTWIILGSTLLLIGLAVSFYGHRLTGRIRSLTDVTERISVGELDIEVEDNSKDEIGELAEAISRMQESIRLSIERLRRRK